MPALTRRQFALGAAALPAAAFASRFASAANADSLAIDEGQFVDINGMEQWITLRGRHARNPVLLWLHGGPGLGMASSAPLFGRWEHRFTIAQWDQPRSGFTHARNLDRDAGPLTFERYLADALAVVRHIRAKLGVERIVILGHSWGSKLGLVMAQRNPELFAAYVGTGQVVSGSRGLKLGYDLALKAARERKDAAAVEALERVGPPPYSTFESWLVRQQYTNPPYLVPSAVEQERSAALAKFMAAPAPQNANFIPENMPKYDMIQAFLEVQRAMFAEGQKFEAETLGTRFRIPMFCFQGENDINSPTALAREYFDKIQAPRKAFHVIPGAGHNTIAFHEELLALLESEVRPLAARPA